MLALASDEIVMDAVLGPVDLSWVIPAASILKVLEDKTD